MRLLLHNMLERMGEGGREGWEVGGAGGGGRGGMEFHLKLDVQGQGG